MPSLSTNERKAKFNANDLIFRKSVSLHSGALLSAECNSTVESLINKYKPFGTKSKQKVNFLNIPKNPFPSTPSKKYIMIEELKDRIKGLKIYIYWMR